MTEADQKLVAAARALLEQADDGPGHCMGIMGDGSKTWKGSFLDKLDKLRTALPEAPDNEV